MLDIAVDKDPAHDGAAAEFLSDLVHRAVGARISSGRSSVKRLIFLSHWPDNSDRETPR